MEKIWTKPELIEEVGLYYIAAIMAEDKDLTRPVVFNVVNGRESTWEKIEKVMEAADKAVVKGRRMKEIRATMKAAKQTPTQNAA